MKIQLLEIKYTNHHKKTSGVFSFIEQKTEGECHKAIFTTLALMYENFDELMCECLDDLCDITVKIRPCEKLGWTNIHFYCQDVVIDCECELLVRVDVILKKIGNRNGSFLSVYNQVRKERKVFKEIKKRLKLWNDFFGLQ